MVQAVGQDPPLGSLHQQFRVIILVFEKSIKRQPDAWPFLGDFYIADVNDLAFQGGSHNLASLLAGCVFQGKSGPGHTPDLMAILPQGIDKTQDLWRGRPQLAQMLVPAGIKRHENTKRGIARGGTDAFVFDR